MNTEPPVQEHLDRENKREHLHVHSGDNCRLRLGYLGAEGRQQKKAQ